MISVICTKCETKLQTDDANAGKRGKCPECGERMLIPVTVEQPRHEPAASSNSFLESIYSAALPLPDTSKTVEYSQQVPYVFSPWTHSTKPQAYKPQNQETKRPLNTCRSCNGTWYPRGTDLSQCCPKCGSGSVRR